MKFLFYFIFCLLILSVACNKSTSIATQNQIVVINQSNFYNERVGIIPIVLAMKPVYSEIKAKELEFKEMTEKQQELSDELTRLQSTKLTPNQKSEMIDKMDEYRILNLKLVDLKKEVQTYFEKRRIEQTKEINAKIGESIKQFAKEKNYTVIIVDNAQELMFKDTDDVTLEFIKYFHMSPKK